MGNVWNPSVTVRRWVFFGYWLLMFIGTHIPRIEELGPASLFGIPHFDKVVHLGMFSGWMGLSFWLLRTRYERPGRAALAGLFVVGALYGIFDELSQSLVGRETSLADYYADAGGLAVALVVIVIRQRKRALPRTA